jgi:hypothetical protein
VNCDFFDSSFHALSSCRALGTQRFNVLARLQFGAYLFRLTVIEVLKSLLKRSIEAVLIRPCRQ